MAFRELLGGVAASPASHAFAITKGVTFAEPARGIYVGTAGDVTLTTISGETVTFTAVPAGMILPVACTQVSEGGDSDDLVGLY